jgi:hypothetical protein
LSFEFRELKIAPISSKNLGFIAFKALGLEIVTFAIVPYLKNSTLKV